MALVRLPLLPLTGDYKVDSHLISQNLEAIANIINQDWIATQVGFSAIPASDQTSFAVDEWVDVVWGTEIFDISGNFASNIFTAPIKGRYQLSYLLRINNLDNTAAYYQAQISTSNRNYRGPIVDSDEFSSDIGAWGVGSSILADMDKDDTAKVQVYQSGGDVQSDIDTNSYFTGFLAIRD